MQTKIHTLMRIFCMIWLVFGRILTPDLHGQEAVDSTPQLHLIGAYFKENKAVVLRWVPSEPGLWRKANFYGYTLERAEVDTLRGDTLSWSVLSRLKPLSLDDWRGEVAMYPTDTMLMVAGQAIHGEKNSDPLTLENMAMKSDQLQNYYSACMLASEFSANAARAAALRYEDVSCKPNTHYLYRLSVTIATDSPIPMEALVAVSTDEEETFPPVESVEINEAERLIELLWNRTYYKNFYSAYNVYRSDDMGKTWVRRNSKPVSYLAYKDENKYIFRDSVPADYVVYQYRIEGITPYATLGPLSEILSAQGRDRTPPDPPYNVKTDYQGKGRMVIRWDVNPADGDIAGFRVARSNEIDRGFVELTPEPLPADARSFVDTTCNELLNNYYFIGVFDKEGNVNVCMPQYGTIIDSVPPAAPVGLRGSIDTAGVVTLSWNLGREPDLKGYFVHYSNNDRHTFINVTDFHLEDTVWRDTIPLNVLTETIHYKVVAIDHRSNYSPYSEMITLRKPDRVPPASPVFVKSVSKKDGIEIEWYNSSSVDVEYHLLLRRSDRDTVFREIYRSKTFAEKSVYLDTSAIAGEKYQYQLVAVDDAGLRSKSVGILSATAFHVKSLAAVRDFKVEKQGDPLVTALSWKADNVRETRFALYRSLNDQPYTLYKSLTGVDSWMDRGYPAGSAVRYRIKAINREGWQSDFTEELVVQW